MLTFWVPKGAVCWDFGGLNWRCGPVDTFYSDEALAISFMAITSLLGDGINWLISTRTGGIFRGFSPLGRNSSNSGRLVVV